MGRDIYGWSFLVFFLALSTVIIAFNCRSFFKYANSDVAGEFLYMKKVYETKNPLTPAYSNSNELFLSRPWLIFCLFYAFGQNLIVSAKLTVITTYLLEVFSAGYLFRKLGWKWPEILIALSALFGLMNIRISTVLFCGSNAYSLFFVGLTLSLGMLAEAGRRGKMRPVCTAVYLTIAFYFGLCGIRMLLFLYLPIFLVECIRTVRKNLDGEPIKMNSIIWKRGGGGLLANVIGIGIYRFVLIPYMHFVHEPVINTVNFNTALSSILSELECLFNVCGVTLSQAPVFSRSGFILVYMIVLNCVLIWGACFLGKRRVFSESESGTLAYLAASTAVLFFCFVISSLVGTYRYWFAVPVISAILVGSVYRYLSSGDVMKYLRCLYSIAIIGGICFFMAGPYRVQQNKTAYMQVAEHLQETGQTRIAGTYWNSSILTLLSNGDIVSLVFRNTEEVPMEDWITDRSKYSNDDEPITIVLSSEEKEAWSAAEKRSCLLTLADSVEEVAGYKLYYYQNNPLAFDLLEFDGSAEFNFLSLQHSEGAYIEDGNVVLPPGARQYGPYFAADAGTYDVVIRGSGLTGGSYYCASDGGAITYDIYDLKIDEQTVSYTVVLGEDAADLELGCTNISDEDMAIEDIMITRRGAIPIWGQRGGQ